ncbi:hypothetical protein C8Q77DRAFT_586099 [Trametes polyzona]|nr:hypothetical protein C8Q77DRAFT_586099 [Trametes polyzona]
MSAASLSAIVILRPLAVVSGRFEASGVLWASLLGLALLGETSCCCSPHVWGRARVLTQARRQGKEGALFTRCISYVYRLEGLQARLVDTG